MHEQMELLLIKAEIGKQKKAQSERALLYQQQKIMERIMDDDNRVKMLTKGRELVSMRGSQLLSFPTLPLPLLFSFPLPSSSMNLFRFSLHPSVHLPSSSIFLAPSPSSFDFLSFNFLSPSSLLFLPPFSHRILSGQDRARE